MLIRLEFENHDETLVLRVLQKAARPAEEWSPPEILLPGTPASRMGGAVSE
jgi:hypothetical protein